jgi:hypothetical protein
MIDDEMTRKFLASDFSDHATMALSVGLTDDFSGGLKYGSERFNGPSALREAAYMRVLEVIAAGHKDAERLAQEVLEMKYGVTKEVLAAPTGGWRLGEVVVSNENRP